MSERVQLLLSDRILGMTLVPEGRVWNYGIGLTQLWSPNIPFAMILDTPLLFWAEEHRPAAFLTVSFDHYLTLCVSLTCQCLPHRSSQILKLARILPTLRTASSDSSYSMTPRCLSSMLYIFDVYQFISLTILSPVASQTL